MRHEYPKTFRRTRRGQETMFGDVIDLYSSVDGAEVDQLVRAIARHAGARDIVRYQGDIGRMQNLSRVMVQIRDRHAKNIALDFDIGEWTVRFTESMKRYGYLPNAIVPQELMTNRALFSANMTIQCAAKDLLRGYQFARENGSAYGSVLDKFSCASRAICEHWPLREWPTLGFRPPEMSADLLRLLYDHCEGTFKTWMRREVMSHPNVPEELRAIHLLGG